MHILRYNQGMKWKTRFLLLVFALLSGCSSATGQAVHNPISTPVAASPTLAIISMTATATLAAPGATSQPQSPTASPSPSVSLTAPNASTTSSAQPSATPFPSASPTAQPQPTQAIKARSSPTPGGPPTATPEPQKSLLDQYVPKRVKVAETDHFIFYAQDGYFPVDQAWWTNQAEIAYAYVSQRLDGAQVKHKINLAFQPPNKDACPVRGLASEGKEPMIILFAGQNSARTYLLAVLSHEIGHAISYEGFPEGLPGNIALAEGIATWGSGKYWAAWKNVPSLDDLIRNYMKEGTYEAIHENTDLHGVYPWQANTGSSQDCLARRDKVYSEWAGFTGYLIDTYGWPKAHQLFKRRAPLQQPGQMIEFPMDYEGVYGKALNQLEWEWLDELGNH
jgi:hypothetical protein